MSAILYVLKKNRIFFSGVFTFLLTGMVLLILGYDPSIDINATEHFWLNIFLVNLTFIGDTIFTLVLSGILVLYYRRKKEGWALLFSSMLCTMVIQLTRIIASGNFSVYMENSQYNFPIPGSDAGDHTGLPSGHTAMVFALAIIVLTIGKLRKWQLTILVIAVAVALSRLYLAGHVLSDLLTGAAIGIGTSLTAISIMRPGIAANAVSRNIKLPVSGGSVAYS